MNRIIPTIIFCLMATQSWAADHQYLIQKGDNLVEILRAKNYGQTYAEILPYVKETVTLNPTVFKNNNANFIVPGKYILLPKNPNEPIPEPEPEPEPEPVVVVPVQVKEPEPEPIPQPKSIGVILSVKGQSEILRDNERIPVIAQDELQEEDTILTKDNTQAKITLLDDTEFTLGSNSHFIVNSFSFADSIQNESNEKDSLIATIQKGVLRIVSGLISKIPNSQYQIRSVFTATIGVRGTDFTVRACTDKEGCGELFGVSAAVTDGGIQLKNQTSEISLNKNEFAQVKSSTQAPKKAPLPEGFFDLDQDVSQIKVVNSWWEKALNWIQSLF